jgi:hypothetical protein
MVGQHQKNSVRISLPSLHSSAWPLGAAGSSSCRQRPPVTASWR